MKKFILRYCKKIKLLSLLTATTSMNTPYILKHPVILLIKYLQALLKLLQNDFKHS